MLGLLAPPLEGASGPGALSQPPLQGKRVLILHSYYKGYRWTDDENRGMESVLLRELQPADIYVEYMDTKRFYEPRYVDQFPEIYRRKFMFHHFDVILASDNNAFDFLRHYRDTLFPGTPVVFCGVNYFNPDDLKGLTQFTGVSEDADVAETLALALRLHPSTQHIFVVNEITETGKTIHEEILRLEPSLAGRVDFTLLEDKSMEEIVSTLRSLPLDSLVFYSFFSRDKTGRVFEYDESASAIAAATTAPIYGAWDFNLGLGIVGGKLISGFYQGETAGKLALRVLRGERADRIPVVRFTPNRYMFDYRQLQRFEINLGDLPKDSIIINQPESLFARYRTISLIGGAVFGFLAVANSILFLNIRRRRQAERALREHQEHLEDLVSQRSSELRESQQLLNKTFASLRDALIIVRADTREILDCNPATTTLFGFQREELIGHPTRLLHADEEAFDHFGKLLIQGIREKGYLNLPLFQMKRKNGEIFPTQHSVLPLYAEDGTTASWVSVIRDITEQNHAEEKLAQYRQKLRALAAELTVVEAKERRAIAAQLHENIGQILATSRLKIAGLKTRDLDPSIRTAIFEIDKLVEETLTQTRSLTYQLSPPILYQLGLEAALEWLGENMEKQHGFRVLFSRQGESGNLDEESSVFLFSAVRELLINVVKHAGAKEVYLRLRWFEDHVNVLVKDDGRGFRRNVLNGSSNPALGIAGSNDGFGLFYIQERVSDFGGRICVRSELSRGTAVKIQLPLRMAVEPFTLSHEHQDFAG